MLILTVFIVATHLINACYSTRLPLEVYELTPSNNNNNNNPAGVTATDLKHKNLEYSTINSPAASTSSSSSSDSTGYFKQHATAAINDPPEQVDLKILSSKEHTQTQLSNQLDRRRSRQMLDLLKTHHDLAGNYNKLHTLQMQLPTTTMHDGGVSSGGIGASSNALHHNGKDVRILYQVGDSEDDLPVCAPNAVCSKIDLYETPWIERQCRCPSINRAPEIVIHHHHKDSHSSHNNHNSEKYHSYYEHTKILHQNKHLLLDAAGFGADKKYDNIHLKKLMHKLGAVYEDDINLPSDYVLHEENSALASNEEGVGSLLYSDDINDNEYPHLAMKRQQQQQQHLFSNSAHMRHSGHMGHQEKLTYIGGCPSGLGVEDGHTIADKTRHYKLCQPVHRLPVCRHFRDYTWTLTTSAEVNSTEQIVHCRCPKNSVTYLTKREPLDDGNSGYKYLFACSPLTRLRCQRKQPCKLFTVRKRQEFIDEVNINALCQCPKGHHCPSHHTQSGVIAGETFLEDNIQTYSGYCMAND